MDLENKEEMVSEVTETTVETTDAAVEEVVVEENTAEDKQSRRRSRGRKQKIETSDEKPQSEWTERVVQIRRVTKVVKGGKKLSFRANTCIS